MMMTKKTIDQQKWNLIDHKKCKKIHRDNIQNQKKFQDKK